MVSPAPTSQAGLPRRGGKMDRSPPGDHAGLGWVYEAGAQPILRVVSSSKVAGFSATVE